MLIVKEKGPVFSPVKPIEVTSKSSAPGLEAKVESVAQNRAENGQVPPKFVGHQTDGAIPEVNGVASTESSQPVAVDPFSRKSALFLFSILYYSDFPQPLIVVHLTE